jgi:uncharacterized damage-inducible protein DinB
MTIPELDHLHDDRSNSIGALLAHVVTVERAYQVLTFEDRDLSPQEGSTWATALKLGLEGQRRLRGEPLDCYLEQLATVRQKTLEELALRDDAWLDTTVSTEPRMNMHWAWFHVAEDEINHRGQMRWLSARLPHRSARVSPSERWTWWAIDPQVSLSASRTPTHSNAILETIQTWPAAVSLDYYRSRSCRPRFGAPQRDIWSVTGKPRTDYTMVYGNSGSSAPVLFGVRDEMYVDFLNNRRAEVSAYRMRQHGVEHSGEASGIMLGSRDYGNSPSPPFDRIGPTFSDIFGCGPEFSVEHARAEFEAGNRVLP